MSWTNRDTTKVEPAQKFSDAAFVESNAKPILDAVPQINAAPANHAVLRQIGTVFNPGGHFGFLFSRQQRPGPEMGMVKQTRHAVLIISKHPIAKGLAVHRAGFGSRLAGMAIQHHRDRKHAPGRFGIL